MKKLIQLILLIVLVNSSLNCVYAQQQEQQSNKEMQWQIKTLQEQQKCLKFMVENNNAIMSIVIAMIVASIGIVFPFMINKKNEKQLNKKLEDYDNKIKQIQDAINKDKTEAKEAANLAQSSQYSNEALQEKDINKKIELYTKAIMLNPKHATAYINRGNAYINKENFNLAINDYKQAMKINPDLNLIVYNCIGVVYMKSNKLKEAINYFTTSISLSHNYPTPYENRARCYNTLAEKETDTTKKEEYLRLAKADEDMVKRLNENDITNNNNII